jgi:hypothetical protein
VSKAKKVDSAGAQMPQHAAPQNGLSGASYFVDARLDERLYALSQKLETAEAAFTGASASDGYIKMSLAVSEFLRGFKSHNRYSTHSDEYSRRFAELASVLSDLDKGIKGPLFKARRGGRHDSEEIWRGRMQTALAIDARMRATGKTRPEVIKEIERKYKDIDGLVTRPGNPFPESEIRNPPSFATSAAEWHSKFLSGKIRAPEAVKQQFAESKRALEAGIQNLSNPRNLSPIKERDYLLKYEQQVLRDRKRLQGSSKMPGDRRSGDARCPSAGA